MKKLSKIFAIVLSAITALSATAFLAACGGDNDADKDKDNNKTNTPLTFELNDAGTALHYVNAAGKKLRDYFKVDKVNDHVTGITDSAKDVMYIIEGDEKCLVVDAMVGIGNCKQMVELFTKDKPYEILLTHGHHDHINGLHDFDPSQVNVYLNKADREANERINYSLFDWQIQYEVEKRYAYTQGFSAKNITTADFSPAKAMSGLKDVDEGDTFQLGNYEIEIIEVPTHTLGSVALLLKDDEIIITGDSTNTGTLICFDNSNSVEDCAEIWKALYARRAEFKNGVYMSHISPETLSVDLIKELYEICDTIVANCKANPDGDRTNLYPGQAQDSRGADVYSVANGRITFSIQNVLKGECKTGLIG